MTDLKQALESGKLDQFIAERKGETGDGAESVLAIRYSPVAPKHTKKAIRNLPIQ